MSPRSPDGGYKKGIKDVSESTQISLDEAKKALEERGGWCFMGVLATGKDSTAPTGNLKEIRIKAIVEVAERLGCAPLCVPTGKKKIIEAECLEKLAGAPYRFTQDTFKKAWQAARNAGLIDVENVDTYRKR